MLSDKGEVVVVLTLLAQLRSHQVLVLGNCQEGCFAILQKEEHDHGPLDLVLGHARHLQL